VSAVSYRRLLADPPARRLLSGLGVSALGDGMSYVTIAWLAVRIAPAGSLGVFVGLAVAAYALPGALGALALSRLLRARPPRGLVLADCALRTACLVAIAALAISGTLTPAPYVALLAASSLLAGWGAAGQYTLLSQVGGADGRLAANSVYSAQTALAMIVGPAVAGALLARITPGWLLVLDAATFAFLGIQAVRTPGAPTVSEQPLDARRAESGFRLLRASGLGGLLTLTWVFFFLYGPVEDALPVYVARDLHSHSGLLGAYWPPMARAR
jgi:MFS family permease